MPKSQRKQSLEPIQSKSLEHLWPLGIAPQHTKVPVPKYFPMTNPLSSLGGSTFDAKIKEKTVIGTIQSKSLEHLWQFGIALQHSKVPAPKYFPMTNSLSSLGGGTFDAKIKEETVIGTHPEQKFEASLATWHCPSTLKIPRTKILPYDKSLVKFGSRYFQGDNQSGNTDCSPFEANFWSIFVHLAMPTNTQKSIYQNIHL